MPISTGSSNTRRVERDSAGSSPNGPAPLRIAVVGCGQIADVHIQEARRIPGVAVVAVCDSNPHMAEQAGVRFGVPGVFTDLGDLLTTARPDVVHVTTPPASHFAIGKMVLEHHCHVYIEKPFTVHLAEAEELVDVAKRVGRLVCVGHNWAFDSAFLRLKDLYQRGVLGEIVHLNAGMGYDLQGAFGSLFMKDSGHWIHRLPGGVAQNNLPHPVSLVLDFLRDDRPKVEVTALRQRGERYGDIRDRFWDELRITLIGERTSASVFFSCRARPVQLYVEAYGTKAQAVASLDARTMRVVRGASLPGPLQKLQWAQQDALEAIREWARHVADLAAARLFYFEGMRELFTRFYRAVGGKGEMPVPMSEAIRVSAILEEIFAKSRVDDGWSRDGEAVL